MANPRKFSEKIALLNQKEAEGNAEFERIMREVSEVSSKVVHQSLVVVGSLVASQVASHTFFRWLANDDDENKCEVPIGNRK